MKQLLTACLLLVGMATAAAQGPSISLDKDVHDYGTITQVLMADANSR